MQIVEFKAKQGTVQSALFSSFRARNCLTPQSVNSISFEKCRAKFPPSPIPEKEVQACTSDEYHSNRRCPLLKGTVFPSLSPKTRSKICVGLGKVGFAFPQATVTGDNVISEDGDCDIRKSIQHCHGLGETPNGKGEVFAHPFY